MSDQLRALAEAEAEKRYEGFATGGALNLAETAFSAGFIAGRTSVTQLEIERAIMGRTATAGARAVLALLNGENDV